MYWIYVLRCPRDLRVKYVGHTSVSPEARLATHLADSELATGTPKAAWLSSLRADGLVPSVEVLETLDLEAPRTARAPKNQARFAARAAEQRWISRFLASGERLLNATSARRLHG